MPSKSSWHSHFQLSHNCYKLWRCFVFYFYCLNQEPNKAYTCNWFFSLVSCHLLVSAQSFSLPPIFFYFLVTYLLKKLSGFTCIVSVTSLWYSLNRISLAPVFPMNGKLDLETWFKFNFGESTSGVGHFLQWTGELCFVTSGDVDSHRWTLSGTLVHQGLWHSGTEGGKLEAHMGSVSFCSSREELAGEGRGSGGPWALSSPPSLSIDHFPPWQGTSAVYEAVPGKWRQPYLGFPCALDF